MTAPTTLRIRGNYPETFEVEVYARWQRKLNGHTYRFVLHLQPWTPDQLRDPERQVCQALREWQISEESTGYRVLYLKGKYNTPIMARDVGRSTARCLFTQASLITHAKKALDAKVEEVGEARFIDVIDRALEVIRGHEMAADKLGACSQPPTIQTLDNTPATYHREAQQQ